MDNMQKVAKSLKSRDQCLKRYLSKILNCIIELCDSFKKNLAAFPNANMGDNSGLNREDNSSFLYLPKYLQFLTLLMFMEQKFSFGCHCACTPSVSKNPLQHLHTTSKL